MPIVENTHTARITATDSILFLPAEMRGEGRGSKLIPSKTALTQEQLDACMADRSTRKLFDSGLLRVVAESRAAAPSVAVPSKEALLAAKNEAEAARFKAQLEADAAAEDAAEATEAKAKAEAQQGSQKSGGQGHGNQNQRR